jgi:hypothetical protein
MYSIYRGVLYFDTSAIPADSIITGVTFYFYHHARDTTSGNPKLQFQNGQPTYPTDPPDALDYDKTKYSGNGGQSVVATSLTLDAWNTLDFNDTGMSWITKAGTTKLYLRTDREIAGTVPSGGWEYISMHSADNLSENKPYLKVTYYAGTASFSPVDCVAGTFNLEIDPTKEWSGSEFEVVGMGDVIGSVISTERTTAPNALEFSLNNYDGRYLEGTYRIKKGDEVKLTRLTHKFYGRIVTIRSDADNARILKVYCESFIGEPSNSHPIQLRVTPTSASGLYWEDYIVTGLSHTGLIPRWFEVVDESGNYIGTLNDLSKTPVAGNVSIIYDKVNASSFLNDISARTGKIWYEDSTTIPGGRKSQIVWAGQANTHDDAADRTFDVESEVLAESLEWDDGSVINRVIYEDAPVIEQDMDSIREYGLHTYMMKAQGIEDMESLAEIAQYIIREHAWARAIGTVPMEGVQTVNLNEIVRIYEDGADDTKTGFDGKFIVVEIVRVMGNADETRITLNSRWISPTIAEIIELAKQSTASERGDPIIILRAETAEARIDFPTASCTLNTEATHVVGRVGFDRFSDIAVDSDYYTIYGFE